MPGANERQPASADRPPASRVGAELQDRIDGQAEISPDHAEAIEADAFEAAKEKQWDQKQTAREGGGR